MIKTSKSNMTTMIKHSFNKLFLTILIFFSFGQNISVAQNCLTPSALNSSSISNFTATLNWDSDTSVHHYRVRYKESGSVSWNFEYGIYTNSETINGLLSNTAYVWQVRAFCSAGNSNSSWWSVEDTFTTSNFPVDCNNTPNGSAYTDSCGNCVDGNTGNLPCIPFSPTVSISLSNLDCNSYSDIIFFTSQDPNEPDISSTVFTSDSGSFDFNGLNNNDTIGSSNIIAGGGFISVSTFLLVDFIISSNRISVKAVDSITGTIYGSFTLENTNPGVMVIAASVPDNNNVTTGNSNEIFLDNIFLNPSPGIIVFTSTINSELGDIDIQTATQSIQCPCVTSYTSSTIDTCDSYAWDGVTYISSGTYANTYLDVNGCDSVHTLNLTINSSDTTSSSETACNSYLWDGVVYTSSGSYTNTYTNALGCDSIHTINLTINSSDTLILNITANATYEFNGVTYDTSGVYSWLGAGVNGCDSLVILNLTVLYCNVPSNLATTNILLDRATLNWDAVSGADHYDVLFSADGISWQYIPNIFSTSRTKSGLSSGNTYYWKVRSVCSPNDTSFVSEWSDSVVFQTLTPCAVPTNPNESTIGLDFADLTWDNVSGAWAYRVRYRKSGSWIFDTTYTNTITINNLDPSSNYNWQVKSMCDPSGVNNSAWTSNQTFSTLTACPNPSSLTVNNITAFSATVQWTGSNSAINYEVYYRQQGSNNWDTILTTTTNTTIPNLIFSTTYEWGVMSICAQGGINNSNVVLGNSFTIDDQCADPSNLTVSGISTDAVTLSWDPLSVVDHFELRYREVGTSSWTNFNNIPGTSTFKNLTGLTLATNYEWELLAVCDLFNNISSWVSGPSFLTLSCPAPINANTSNILLDKATLNWDAVSVANYYEIRIKEISSNTWQYITANSTSRTKSNLSSATDYHWQVRTSCNSSGTNVSEWSDTVVFQTLTPCAVPTNLNESTIGVNFADLTWDNVSGVWAYRVRYRKSGSWIIDTTYTNTITINNLDHSSNYSWQVKSMCDPSGINNSAWTSNQTFSTLIPCPNPNGLTVDSTDVNSAYLSWNNVSGADHYLVLYSELGSNIWSSQVTTSPLISLTGLSTYSPYEWKLLVYCDPNGLNNSDTISGPNFTTANPCTTPNNLSVSNILLDRFTMNWDVVALANSYEIRIRETGSSWDTITNVFGTSRTKSNLNSATTYEWQIRSICNLSGTSFSDWSSTQTTTTLTPCAITNNMSSSNVLLTSANLSWDAVSGVWAYRVRYRVSGSWIIDTTYTNSISLTNLSNSSTYNWQVKSMCDPSGVNNSAWTSLQNFTTLTPCTNPHSFSVSQITLTSAKLSWSGPNNPHRYYVWYKDINDSLWIQLTILPSFINGTNASKTVTGLSPATTYEWQVQANCLSNNTNLSDTVYAGTFTTVTPCAIPTNLNSSVNGNGVTLNWDAVTGAVNYTLKVRQSGTGAWTTYNPTSNSRTINGLIFGVSYEWKILSNCNNSGTNSSAYSSIETFTTGSCPDVQNVGVTNIQTDRAKITWSSNSAVDHYELRAREIGTTTWTKFIQNIYATNRTISGLLSGVTYEAQVRSACTVDTSSVSAWSSSITFTTLIDCSTKPSNITTSNITLTSIDFAFTGSPNAIQYVVRFRKSSASVWDYDTLTAPTTSFVKSALDSNSTYYYQIRSICLFSPLTQSGWTPVQSANTLQPCATPTGLGQFLNQTTNTSFKIEWKRTGSVYAYNVILKDVTSSTWDTIFFVNSTPITGTSLNSAISGLTVSTTLSGNKIRVVFGGLSPSTTYEWQVNSVCLASGENNSAFFAGTNITTSDPCVIPTNLNSSVNGNGVTLNWDAVTGAVNYTVQLRQSGSTNWITYNPTSNSRTINGLIFGYTYEWRVLSNCNNSGTNSSAYSSIETFTTGSCPDVQNVGVTNIQTDRAKITWSSNSAVDHYELRAREIGTTTWTKFIQNIYATNRTISGLLSGVTYEAQVRSACTVDTSSVSAWSSSITFTTLIDCSTKPSNITTSNITLTSIDFAFTGSPNAIQYVVRFRKSSASVWDYDTLTAPTTSFVKSALDSNSTYYYQIRSICLFSPLTQSGWTPVQSANTLQPCATPTGLGQFLNQTTNTSFKIEWKRTGSVYAYNVILKDVTSSTWDTIFFVNSTPITGTSLNSAISGLTVSTTLSGNKIRVVFGGLSPSTIYDWQVNSVCLASGENNSAFVYGMNILTLDPCATPDSLLTNNITNTSAKLNWLATSNALTYQIRAREVGSSLWTKNVSGITSTNRNISNLSDGVSYEWQVRGICSTDTSDVSPWSSLATFSTPISCVGAPSNTNESNISLNQATLNWNIHPSAQVYVLRFRHSSTSVWTYDTLASTSVTKTGLLQQATYYWQVRSICDLTNNIFGPWSNLRNFNTLAPCFPATNLTTYNNQNTLSTAKVSWKGPNVNTYYVIFRDINASSWDTLLIGSGSNPSVTVISSSSGINATASNSGTTKNLNFSGLNAGSTYEWQVISLCTSSNISQPVSGNNFTTLDPCTDPTGLSSTPVTTSSIVSWNPVIGAVKYELRKRPQGSSSWGNSIILTNTSRNFSNLTPATTYEWQVRSYCDNSGNNVSNWVTATFTTQNVCTKPTNPFENNITTTSATLNWDATPTGAWGYRIQYMVNGAPGNTKITDTSNVNFLDISNLTPSTTYRWRVKAICNSSGNNNSPWKQWQYFSTPSGIRISGGDILLIDNLTIYPNPTRGIFNLTYTQNNNEDISVEVIDAFGKRIFNDTNPVFFGEYNKQIDLSHKPKGVYIVQVYTGSSYVSKRLVVQ